jgi:hypothetical protein
MKLAEIRTDIFPRMVPLFETREQVLTVYIDETYDALSSLFPSKDELIEYINSLDNHETAELFIRISRFYLISKRYQPTSYVKLIMIISAIERTVSKDKKYQEFSFWIEKQKTKIKEDLQKSQKLNEETFLKVMRALREDYFKTYGSARNVIDFFENHLSENDKIELIKSFRGNRTNVISYFCLAYFKQIFSPFPTTIEEASKKTNQRIYPRMMPYCYDWKQCFVGYGNCSPEISCALKNDKTLLKKTLKKVVNDLYQLRNDFVHTARVTPLNEQDAIGTLAVIGADRKPVSIELTAQELEAIFERGLKHYFDDFVNR